MGAEAGVPRDDDERNPVSSRDDTPEGTLQEGQKDGAGEETTNGDENAVSGEAGKAVDAEDKPSTQDVEMGEEATGTPFAESQVSVTEETASTPAPSGTNGDDIEMTSSQSKPLDSTPPTSSTAPSRQPSPPATKTELVEKPKARALQCVRHTIFQTASLLSLSFDNAGR